jgi:thioredoxin-like negative regulator of GroEL
MSVVNKGETKMKEKVITIFHTEHCKQGNDLVSYLLSHQDIDPEKVQVILINESPEMSTFFRVMESPTVLMFEDGEETVRYEGVVPPEFILAFLAN